MENPIGIETHRPPYNIPVSETSRNSMENPIGIETQEYDLFDDDDYTVATQWKTR